MPGRPDDLLTRVARAIATERRTRGLTQEALAQRLGISVKNLQRLESGTQNLTLRTIENVAAALGTEAGALLRGEAPPTRALSILERLEHAGHTVRAATVRGRRPRTAIPVMTIRAAAGSLTGEARSPEVLGWLLPAAESTRDARADTFVAEIEGTSMEPRLHDGALVLFGPAGPPPYGQRMFLVAHRDLDDDLGGPYAVKRIRPRKSGGVFLESTNPDFAPIAVRDPARDLRVMAEVIRILVDRREVP